MGAGEGCGGLCKGTDEGALVGEWVQGKGCRGFYGGTDEGAHVGEGIRGSCRGRDQEGMQGLVQRKG